MPVIEKNPSNFLNGTVPTNFHDSDLLAEIIRDAKSPGEGKVQSFSDLLQVLKRVVPPSVASARLENEVSHE